MPYDHGYQTCDRFVILNHGRNIGEMRRDETSIEELTKIIVAN